jgi:hypothetical protein
MATETKGLELNLRHLETMIELKKVIDKYLALIASKKANS